MKDALPFVIVGVVVFSVCAQTTDAFNNGQPQLRPFQTSASAASVGSLIKDIFGFFSRCNAPVGTNVQLNCTKTEKKVTTVLDCTSKLHLGSKVTMKCMPGFATKDRQKFITCAKGKKYNKPMITCSPAVTTPNTTIESTTEASTEATTESVTEPSSDTSSVDPLNDPASQSDAPTADSPTTTMTTLTIASAVANVTTPTTASAVANITTLTTIGALGNTTTSSGTNTTNTTDSLTSAGAANLTTLPPGGLATTTSLATTTTIPTTTTLVTTTTPPTTTTLPTTTAVATTTTLPTTTTLATTTTLPITTTLATTTTLPTTTTLATTTTVATTTTIATTTTTPTTTTVKTTTPLYLWYAVVPGIGIPMHVVIPAPVNVSQAACKKDGGNLFLIDTQAREDFAVLFIDTFMLTNPTYKPEINGGVFKSASGWQSFTGVPISSLPFFKWAPGQPVGKYYCTRFNKAARAHYETDCYDPTHQLSTICERP